MATALKLVGMFCLVHHWELSTFILFNSLGLYAVMCQLGLHCTAFVRCNSWSGLDYSAVNYKRYKNDFNQELSSIQPPLQTGYCTQQAEAMKFCYIVNLHLSFFTLGFLCHNSNSFVYKGCWYMLVIRIKGKL